MNTIAIYGDPALAPPESRVLRAGPLTMSYTSGGDLRTISGNGVEVLNRIYAAVRAGDWWTVPAERIERRCDIGEETFAIVYEARYGGGERGIDFRATVTITGDASGHVVFDFDGVALSSFDRNRIGICVLHPSSAGGTACTITHASDASVETGVLPGTISPHQPFLDIAAITHAVAPGIEATVAFFGDVFEMEDQRNWLDASFKTYSTPLSIPYPVTVTSGDRVHQTVTLTPKFAPGFVRSEAASDLTSSPTTANPFASIASIGLRWPESGLLDGQRLPLLPTGHLWAELDLSKPNWQALLAQADADAQHHGVSLYVCLKSVASATSLEFLAAQSPCRWFVEGVPMEEIRQALRAALPDADLSVGFLSNFTELNRVRPDASDWDGLFFAANPQVHAFDSTSIAETPPVIGDVIRTARTFADGKPVHIGPLTFTGRYATNDPREQAAFGQGWYREVLSHAAAAGADSVTLGWNAVGMLEELLAATPTGK